MRPFRHGALEDASSKSATAGLQAHAAAAEEICHCSDCLPVIPAVCADREDQVAQGEVLVGLFHGRKRLKFWLGKITKLWREQYGH